MIVVLSRGGNVRLVLDGKVVVVRKDEAIELTKAQWNALDPQIRGLFTIQESDDPPAPPLVLAGKVIAVPPMTFYGTEEGGRVTYSASTGFVAIPSGKDALFCALVNPAGSGKDLFLDWGEFSADANTKFARYGMADTAVTGRTEKRTPNNLTRGLTPSVAEMYTLGKFSANIVGITPAKVAYMLAYDTYEAPLGGRSQLRPGRALVWTIDGKTTGAGVNASIYFEWWELPAES